mmetsp:Transcript_10350/g.43119  ORF Transcript_10350/g.43119 Transcript_10350/m.43119 type:complete len:197 (-) Transcript_10350:1726-2316(-)
MALRRVRLKDVNELKVEKVGLLKLITGLSKDWHHEETINKLVHFFGVPRTEVYYLWGPIRGEIQRDVRARVPITVNLFIYEDGKYDFRYWAEYNHYLNQAARVRARRNVPGRINGWVTVKEIYEISKISKQTNLRDKDLDLQDICMKILKRAKQMGLVVVERRVQPSEEKERTEPGFVVTPADTNNPKSSAVEQKQ